MPVIGGDQQRVVVLDPIEEASELVINFLMYREHRLGRRAIRPISQRIT